MKPLIENKDGRLSAASREAMNKVLDRINARRRSGGGNKKGVDTAQNGDSAKVSSFSSWQEEHCCFLLHWWKSRNFSLLSL